MAGGGYRGGSTIIRPGSNWFSNTRTGREGKDPKPTGADARKIKAVTEEFLEQIFYWLSKKAPEPNYPVEIEEHIAIAVHEAGGLIKWALAHPYYQSQAPAWRKTASALATKVALENATREYVRRIVVAQARGNTLPTPPPSLHRLWLTGKTPAEVLAWAMAQSCYGDWVQRTTAKQRPPA